MGSRTFPLDIIYKSASKGCFFPCPEGIIWGKDEGKKGDSSFSLACLWVKAWSDSIRHNRGISVLFSSKRKTNISLSTHIFKLWKFQTKDQTERNFPKLHHLSLLQFETQTNGTSQTQSLAYQNIRGTVLSFLGSSYQRLQLKTKIPFLWYTAKQKNTSQVTASSKTSPSNTSTSTFRRQTLEGKCLVNHYFYN